MNVKKEVWKRIVKVLEHERHQIQDKIWKNRGEFKRLADEQTILKRERAALDALMRDLMDGEGEIE